MNKFFEDLKAFLLKGNIIDLGVAFIIGAAFKAIITSFVNDIIMPPIGLATGGTDFAELKFILQAASETTSEVAIRYGLFLQKLIDFIVTGTAIFVGLEAYNKSKKKEEEEVKEEAPPEPSDEVKLLTEIRDSLKK